MKTVILSYSLTGNNESLAKRIAQELQVEHIRITEPVKRTNGTIAADLILGRTPKTKPDPQVMSAYNFIIFVAPIWMGQPAFPLRSYLKQLKTYPQKYVFVFCKRRLDEQQSGTTGDSQTKDRYGSIGGD